jgi:hypothetical protein
MSKHTKRDILELNSGINAYLSIGQVEGITDNFAYAISKNKRKIAVELEDIKKGMEIHLKEYREEGQKILKEKFNNVMSEFEASQDKKELEIKYDKQLNNNKKFLDTIGEIEIHKCEIPQCILKYPAIADALFIMSTEPKTKGEKV